MNDPRHGFLERGGVWVIVQFTLMAAVIVLGVAFPGDWTRHFVIGVGAGLFAMGGYVGIAGVVALGKNRTPFPRPPAESRLVESGIYARLRHPLYTSVMLASLGWALIWQSLSAFIAAFMLIPFLYAKARREEAWLGERFPAYAAYARRVPRFLPRFRSRPNLVCNL